MGLTDKQKKSIFNFSNIESNHIKFMTHQVTTEFPVILLF